jgi:hypothetical protein
MMTRLLAAFIIFSLLISRVYNMGGGKSCFLQINTPKEQTASIMVDNNNKHDKKTKDLENGGNKSSATIEANVQGPDMIATGNAKISST